MFYESIKHRKCVFFATLPLYHQANEEAYAVYYTVIKHSGHLRTLEKRRKHSPATRVFLISLLFSNARRVLSQCNTRLRLLYLLNNHLKGYHVFMRKNFPQNMTRGLFCHPESRKT